MLAGELQYSYVIQTTTTYNCQVGPQMSWHIFAYIHIQVAGHSSQLQSQGSEIIPRWSERVII
jgi:hypothetical protein